MEQPKWKKFEELVAKIQMELAGDAVVTPNDRIRGKVTGIPRQVDVSIRKQVGQFELLIVLDCKDHRSPLDVKDVEEFMGLAQDVGAHKAGMVAASSFSEAAKKRARDAGIEIYRVVDTGDHDWRSMIEIPAAIEFTGVTKFSLSFSAVGGEPFMPPDTKDLRTLVLFDEQDRPIGRVRDLIGQKWNSGEIPQEPGEYRAIPLAPEAVEYHSGGRLHRARVAAAVRVEARLHFGYWPIKKLSGFYDEKTGAIMTRNMEFDWLSMVEVERSWPRINSLADLAVRPVITFRALDYWSADDPL